MENSGMEMDDRWVARVNEIIDREAGLAVVEEPSAGWERNRQIRSFEDLRVWQYGRNLRNDVAQLARALPPEEKFRLADQMIRASRSVTNNLAEGYGRFTYNDNIHFCRQSRSSLYELIDHLSIALDEGCITEEQYEQHRTQCMSATRLLNGYIRYLQQQSRTTK